MITIAYPIRDEKIAPFFDAATELHIVRIDDDGRREATVPMESNLVAMRARDISEYGIDVLLCNAVSASQAVLIRALGIRIDRWVGEDPVAAVRQIEEVESFRETERIAPVSAPRIPTNVRFRRPARRFVGYANEFQAKVA